MGAILATGTQPMISQMRLAWWREALQRLDDGGPAPAEPVLQALAQHVIPRGVGGSELAAMEDGWLELVAEGTLGEEALRAYAEARGARLFRLSARLLGGDDKANECEGARWALVDLARRSSDPAEKAGALDLARSSGESGPLRGKLRPLGLLAVLTKRDLERDVGSLEPQGSPARMLRLIKRRLTGS